MELGGYYGKHFREYAEFIDTSDGYTFYERLHSVCVPACGTELFALFGFDFEGYGTIDHVYVRESFFVHESEDFVTRDRMAAIAQDVLFAKSIVGEDDFVYFVFCCCFVVVFNRLGSRLVVIGAERVESCPDALFLWEDDMLEVVQRDASYLNLK